MRSSSRSRRYIGRVDWHCVFRFQTETPPGTAGVDGSRRDLRPRPATVTAVCVGRIAHRPGSRREPPANSAKTRIIRKNNTQSNSTRNMAGYGFRFVIKLPPSKKLIIGIIYNFIIVVTDRLTKYAYFIPYFKSFSAEDLAYIFYKYIMANYKFL
jgi:hypothetical protein